MDIDIAEVQDKIKKYKRQLLQVKTNEEYISITNEIKHEEERISLMEEERLKLMENMDNLSKEIKNAEKELEEAKKAFEKKKEELNRKLKEIEDKLKSKKEERQKLSSKIDKKVLNRYERIRAIRNGIGIANVNKGYCSGCHAVVPPQIINEVRKGEKLIICQQCGRILFWEE